MAFGDAAKGALEQALAAYKAVVQLQAVIESLERNIQRLEERQERHSMAMEQRFSDRFRVAEERVRQLEVEVASLRGKVDGGLVEALKIVLLEPESRRRLSESPFPTVEGILDPPSTQVLPALRDGELPPSGTE